MTKRKIAIVGSGISGLTCAYTLASRHNIKVFEAADYIGGHTHTVQVEKENEISNIDTGFIVFNDRTYPNFIHLMNTLGVKFKPTEMSFSVRNDHINLEYNGNNINTLFAQRSNLLKPYFWAMVRDIIRFNKEVRLSAVKSDTKTIGEFVESGDYSTLFVDNYLLPMISAIWSMGLEECMEFPLQFFVRFFENHGLLDLTNRPQWYTIEGGSSTYIEPLIASFKDSIVLNKPVLKVKREEGKVEIVTSLDKELFDEVIFACHARQALKVLVDPTASEQSVLKEFESSENSVVLHTDVSFLPRRKLAWASWNYNMLENEGKKTTLTYNMNILQRLQKKQTYLVTLNQDIPEKEILKTFNYEHPIFTLGAIKAQKRWQEISGVNNIHYCGAYWFNGFHEDGVNSGLRVCRAMEV